MSTTRDKLNMITSKVRAEEPEFLKYLIDCAENIVSRRPPHHTPAVMQLYKLRAEASQRLYEIYGIKYGKWAEVAYKDVL